jgi:hypothetical protein
MLAQVQARTETLRQVLRQHVTVEGERFADLIASLAQMRAA